MILNIFSQIVGAEANEGAIKLPELMERNLRKKM